MLLLASIKVGISNFIRSLYLLINGSRQFKRKNNNN